MAEFRLETPRLVLRDWREGDIHAFARVTNTPAVMRWLGGVVPDERLAEMEARMLRLGMRRRKEPEFVEPRFEPPIGNTVVHSLTRADWERPGA